MTTDAPKTPGMELAAFWYGGAPESEAEETEGRIRGLAELIDHQIAAQLTAQPTRLLDQLRAYEEQVRTQQARIDELGAALLLAQETRRNVETIAAGLAAGETGWRQEIARLEAQLEQARGVLNTVRLEMVKFGNITNWPDEMPQSYADAMNLITNQFDTGILDNPRRPLPAIAGADGRNPRL